MTSLESTVTTLLENAADAFDREHPNLTPVGDSVEVWPTAVSLQRGYAGAHTLTLTTEFEPLTAETAKARVRASFYDEGLKRSHAKSATGYFFETPSGWQFTRGRNKHVSSAITAAKAFDFLARW